MAFIVMVIAVMCAVISTALAQQRGRSAVGWAMAGLLLGPLGFVVGLLPTLEGGAWRRCPSCAELVRREAVRCRFCGEALPVVTADVPAATGPSDVVMWIIIGVGVALIAALIWARP